MAKTIVHGESSPAHIAGIKPTRRILGADVIIGVGGGKSLDAAKQAADRTRFARGLHSHHRRYLLRHHGNVRHLQRPRRVSPRANPRPESQPRLGRSGDHHPFPGHLSARRASWIPLPSGTKGARYGSQLRTRCPKCGGISTGGSALQRTPKVCHRGCTLECRAPGGRRPDSNPRSHDPVDWNDSNPGQGNTFTGLAHPVHNGLTLMPESHEILHGLKVGYGIMVQLCVQKCPRKEFEEALSFFRKLGLEPSLKGLKLPFDREMILRVAEKAANDPDIGPLNFPVNKVAIASAMEKLKENLRMRSQEEPGSKPHTWPTGLTIGTCRVHSHPLPSNRRPRSCLVRYAEGAPSHIGNRHRRPGTAWGTTCHARLQARSLCLR